MSFALLHASIAGNSAQKARVRGELGTVPKQKLSRMAEQSTVAIQGNASYKLLDVGTLYAGLTAFIARAMAPFAGIEARLVL